MKPLVSIIIPTYNRAHLIGETLDSVIAQTYKKWECIVVDDGSTDYTDELLEFYSQKDPRIQYYRRPEYKPKGANACRNYGFEMSIGKYIQWFDSDDLLNSIAIEKKIKIVFDRLYTIAVCHTAYFHTDKSTPLRVINNTSSNSELLIDYLTGKINIHTPSVFWSRKVVQDFKFDENLSRAQELDFHFRVLQSPEITTGFIDEVLVFIRSHKKSMTGDYNEGRLNRIYSELHVRRKTLYYVFNTDEPYHRKVSCLNIYLQGIRRLYKHHPIFTVVDELKEIEHFFKLMNSYFWWKYLLISLILLYKITGREFRLKNHLYKIKENICL